MGPTIGDASENQLKNSALRCRKGLFTSVRQFQPTGRFLLCQQILTLPALRVIMCSTGGNFETFTKPTMDQDGERFVSHDTNLWNELPNFKFIQELLASAFKTVLKGQNRTGSFSTNFKLHYVTALSPIFSIIIQSYSFIGYSIVCT